MFKSMFGKKKGRRSSAGKAERDDSIRSAGVGDVVVIPGFSPNLDDATFLIESKSRLESDFGNSYELAAVDGDRKVSIEWSNGDELSILVTEHGEKIQLSEIGAGEDVLVRMDNEKSTENFVEYRGQQYFYRNSYEVSYFKDNGTAMEGFYMWDFGTEDEKQAVSVIKWEGMPYEVYASLAVSPHVVRVYQK
ncbi:hypothetical protein M1N23_00830 [Dehalococcoidia bacterium]|nr:hypothetical protein [Dehalococcoidia bacterium]